MICQKVGPIHSNRGTDMNGVNYLFKNRIDIYYLIRTVMHRSIGTYKRTLDKPRVSMSTEF